MKWCFTIIIALLTVSAATAQMAMPPAQPGQMAMPDPQAAQAPPPTPIAQIYAVYTHGAVPEQPFMDDNLKPVKEVLNKLPFTSYETVNILSHETPWETETPFAVNAKYTVNVWPHAPNEENAIDLDVRIEMLQKDGSYVDAIIAKALAAENKALVFRGMPLNNGELVVVLFIKMPSEKNQDGDDSQEQEQQQQEEQEDQKDEQEQQEEQQEDENAESQEANEEDREGEEEKEGLENLDALLESLEDIDKREQAEERNQRDRIDFKGDWW